MGKFNKLSRIEMKKVLGGTYPARCTTICVAPESTLNVISGFCGSPAITMCPGGIYGIYYSATCSCAGPES